MTQQTLWTDAGVPATNTRAAAAVTIGPLRASMQERVLQFLRGRGDFGATDEEIHQATHLNPSSVRPRRGELVDAGQVADSGRTRPSSSGRPCVVWIAKD
jgi:hypothetical protein